MELKTEITWRYEEGLYARGLLQIAGVDEVGRGPLAGSVVAAAVILPRRFKGCGLNDSKKLTPAKRSKIAAELRGDPEVVWALGEATVEEIDQHNILQATFIAMRRAVDALSRKPDFALVDGNQDPQLGVPIQTIIGGDGLSPSIAAASIIAKHHRDESMERLAEQYPGYGLEKHKGYGTALHLAALKKLGPTPIHRISFEPVRKSLR